MCRASQLRGFASEQGVKGSKHLTCMHANESICVVLENTRQTDTLCKLAGSPGLLGVSQPCKAFRHRALGLINLRQNNPSKAVLGLALTFGVAASHREEYLALPHLTLRQS